MAEKEKILILTGSKNDLPQLEKATRFLDSMKVSYRVKVASAHRTPDEVVKTVKSFSTNHNGIIIAAAGLANHLAGAAASRTVGPVIGVPLGNPPLSGLDSLFSTVQMPPGIPVATVGIGSTLNAAILAVEILALSDSKLRKKLEKYREDMRKR